jgi:hypothetical protein
LFRANQQAQNAPLGLRLNVFISISLKEQSREALQNF